MCELLPALCAAAHSRGWAFHFVVENVVMNEHEAHYFNTQLGVQSFVMDAGDMTRASRPRLWWTSFPNGEESHCVRRTGLGKSTEDVKAAEDSEDRLHQNRPKM